MQSGERTRGFRHRNVQTWIQLNLQLQVGGFDVQTSCSSAAIDLLVQNQRTSCLFSPLVRLIRPEKVRDEFFCRPGPETEAPLVPVGA